MITFTFNFCTTEQKNGIEYGNNEKSVNPNFTVQNKLSDDPNFIELIKEMKSFENLINATTKKNNLSINDVQLKLNELSNKNLDYDLQLNEVNKIFKSNVTKSYINHVKSFNENWYAVKVKYPKITLNDIQEGCVDVMDKAYVNTGGDGCDGWRFGLCAAAATAGAILCHAGCDTTALATTAGLGIPACIWLCGTIQVAAIVSCGDSYCP